MLNLSPMYNKLNVGDTLRTDKSRWPSLGRGWSEPEDTFCWTDGRFAEISFVADHDLGPELSLAFHCHPFISASQPDQEALFFIHGLLMAAEIFDKDATAYIPLPQLQHAYRHFTLTIYFPSAVRPSVLNPNSKESRMLAVRVFSLGLVRSDQIK